MFLFYFFYYYLFFFSNCFWTKSLRGVDFNYLLSNFTGNLLLCGTVSKVSDIYMLDLYRTTKIPSVFVIQPLIQFSHLTFFIFVNFPDTRIYSSNVWISRVPFSPQLASWSFTFIWDCPLIPCFRWKKVFTLSNHSGGVDLNKVSNLKRPISCLLKGEWIRNGQDRQH